VRTYNKADTVAVFAENKTYNFTTEVWTTGDADANYPKITITDPDGTVKVDAASMTKDTTGKYEYLYQLATDASKGEWIGYVQTANNSKTDKKYFSFAVR